MSIVSVERFSTTLGDAVLTADETLTKSQVTGNCIPFVTTRITTIGSGGWDNFRTMNVEAWFPDGSTVRVERQNAVAGQVQMVAEITVVEFDGTDIVVQQGQYSMADTETSDVVVPGSTVTLANTFLYHNWGRGGNVDPNYDCSALRGRITGTQELTFDRVSGDKPIEGRWYLADATVGGDFTVQAKDIALTTSQGSNTASLTAVTLNKTFLIGSYSAQPSDPDAVSQATIDVNISDTTTISLQRDDSTSAGTLDWHGFAVSMADSTLVQRGTRVQSTSTASDSFDITTPITLADSWVHVAGSNGAIGGGSWAGASSDWVTDSFVALDFVDSDTIRIQRSTESPSDSDADISWEVIEFDSGAAPARRVMVVS